MISIGLLVSGLLVIYLGRVERLSLDRQALTISKSSTSVLCQTEKEVHHLHDIEGLRIIKRGKDTGMSSTVRFKVVARMSSGRVITLKRSRNLDQAQVFVRLT